jgi:hypothetical protein
VALRPNADGFYTSWSGANGYTKVNDLTRQAGDDGSTTQITTSGTTGLRQSVKNESTSARGVSGTINAVKAHATINGSNMNIFVRSGTSEQATTSLNPGASYVGNEELLPTDPATSAAWTLAGVDGAQVGVTVDNISSAACTLMALMVSFVPSLNTTPPMLTLLGVGR